VNVITRDPLILIPFGALAFVSVSILRVIISIVKGRKLYEPPVARRATVDDPNRNTEGPNLRENAPAAPRAC
jgi:hypothetical protein